MYSNLLHSGLSWEGEGISFSGARGRTVWDGEDGFAVISTSG